MLRRLIARIGVPVAHPFLFAVFPILSMYSANVGEAEPREVLVPAAAALVVAAAAWLLLSIFSADRLKKAAVLSVLWIPFYTFGSFVDWVVYLHPRTRTVLVLVWLAVVYLVCVWLAVTKRQLTAANRFLNFVAVCAVVLPLLLTTNHVRQRYQLDVRPVVETAAEGNPDDPDIYYIILDSYTRQDYLAELFGHDNGPFLDELRARGFYIADRSRSNYETTHLSLASSLNMSYAHVTLPDGLLGDPAKLKTFLSKIVWRNEVLRVLRARDYEFVTFASKGLTRMDGLEPDRYIAPEKPGLTDFQQKWLDMTPLRAAAYRFFVREEPDWLFHALDHLPELERQGRPIFALAHVLAPHVPHTVDEHGNPVSAVPFHEGYRNEVRYLNKRLPEIVDRILQRQPNSVFLIQGDHGPWSDWRGKDVGVVKEFESWPAYVRDRTLILSAYYFPGRDYEGLLYPEITPVNSFRAVFNAHFGMSLDRLEDVSYLPHWEDDAGTFRRVTEVY